MRVVIAQNPRPVPIIQSQAVAHASRHEGGRNNFPSIYLDSVAALLLENAFVEFEKSGQAFVWHCAFIVSSDDTLTLRLRALPEQCVM